MPVSQVETASTTSGLRTMLKSGQLRQSADGQHLLDANGKAVATRIASKEGFDHYADINQTFSETCKKVCLDYECDGVKVCLCVSWGCGDDSEA